MPKKRKTKSTKGQAVCKRISYVRNGKRITYFRKVKILSSGKWKFVKGKCKTIKKRIKRKR